DHFVPTGPDGRRITSPTAAPPRLFPLLRPPFAEADGNRTRPPSLPGALVLKTRRATRPQSPPGSGYLWPRANRRSSPTQIPPNRAPAACFGGIWGRGLRLLRAERIG